MATPTTSRLLIGIIGVGVCGIIGLATAIGYLLTTLPKPMEPTPLVEILHKTPDIPKPKDAPKSQPEKKPTEEKKPAKAELAGQIIDRLNRYRKFAGLGNVTLDADLSQGCQAHAEYLARHADPQKLDGFHVTDQDPAKAGHTVDGQRAARNSLIAAAEPGAALERWMGQVFPRALLLTPEIQSVGIGFEQTKNGWFCVVDPVRGRGLPIVIYPAPKQIDVPLSFTSGPEVPDEKAAAGFPVTISFPSDKKVTNARIELLDSKGKSIDGWISTPEKSAHGANTLALIPKSLLQGLAEYEVRASAKVDGKAWELTWSFTAADDSDCNGEWAKKALAKVNGYRAIAGLKPVELDAKLSRGCLAHARYLVLNEGDPALAGLKAHDEDLKLPGASEEGRAAGKASNIAIGDYEPTDGIDAWLATLYHRVPILEPNLTTIGFGCVRGRRQGWTSVLNVLTGSDKSDRPQAIFYPVPDQTGVPLNFPNGGEEPNPIPDDTTGKAGFPITAFFPRKEPLTNAAAKLNTEKGVEIACWFSSPEKPANPKFPQGNTVALIPKKPLAAKTTYQVHLQGQRNGQAWERKWKFTTGTPSPEIAVARKQVFDRLNEFRANAGLGAVALDTELTRGCQLHAEYLANNADALLKKDAPVNDEDARLPGFTRDGLRAAQKSLVFTNAPNPVVQIDDLIASATGRGFVLHPHLQRIGFGCAHDIGRGWRCVLDVKSGLGDSRVIVFPAANQLDVPTVGFDPIEGAKSNPGFPITVIFPRQAILRNVQAVLTDAKDAKIETWISSPAQPLDAKRQQAIVSVRPLSPLQPGQRYSITVSAIVNGAEWRESWKFTTRK